ncbi:Nif3-like dinuclear metal center hexameric protein [Shouchella shacheensis]|uniref:Nif3-like dinuclear metal center hexameric protein n=1 Tax=Shouchella shacheensis TaxID=1649580 RepID=UPI00073FCC22|nr:Nif3-like dinuclear metal center hexameric protein [Shouchella shacheensis]
MRKEVQAQTLIQQFEQFSPKSYAVEGDKNGLMVGTLNKSVKRVMIALDVLEATMEEAVDKKVDLIIAHHPLLFRPLKQVNLDTAHGRIISMAIKHDITIYAAHTNLDVTKGGVNDLLAEALELKETEVLAPLHEEGVQKLVSFVPETEAAQVREALGQAGAGFIGEYSHCSFQSAGTGTFRPTDAANPFIGEAGVQEFVNEVKIETIVRASESKKVIAALQKAHPYEEPAYDLYPLDNEGEAFGLGRVGTIADSHTLETFAEKVKEQLGLEGVRVVGDLKKNVRKVAVLGGDGNKYMNQALRKGADVLVTGDVYYHVAHDAQMDGLSIIDAGHHIEQIMKRGVSDRLNAVVEENGYEVEVFPSVPSTDPFQFL